MNSSKEQSSGMVKAWESTLKKTQAAAKKRAHSIFGGTISISQVNNNNNDNDFTNDDEGGCNTEVSDPVEKYFPNGDYYMGQWRDDQPQGHGKYLWMDGCMYIGEWSNGQFIGKGWFGWSCGAVYEGEFKNGYMDGRGKYTGPNGESYKGFWVMNLKHGYGSLCYKNGDVYEGDWRHGVQEGQGKYQWSNGSCYVGEWKNGVFSGPGFMVWANGNYYEGDWLDGLPKGDGIFKRSNGSYYEGKWSQDMNEMTGNYHPESSEESNWDPRELYNDLSNGCSQICASETISLFPSQKKLATSSSKGGTGIDEGSNRIRAGRMSIDSRLPEFEGRLSNEEVSRRNSVGGREVSLEGLNLESYIAKMQSSNNKPFVIPKCGNKKPGEIITKDHKSYELMLNLQLGIRHAVERPALAINLELKASAFDPKDKIWTKFPPEGSKQTPPHSCSEFRWKDYCPLVFRALRKLFKVDSEDYMSSICGTEGLRELSSPGKSGSFFYLSSDDRYFIKTMKKAEVKVFIRMLSAYYNHVRACEHTLITKFFGLHCVKLTGPTQKKVRFIIMGNLFCTEYTIHRRFDLKGSSTGRFTDKPEEELDASAILKDLDLNFVFRLDKSWFEEFCRQVDKDCEFLEQERIMDYSMLVGIHFKEASKAGDLVASESRTPTGCDDRESDQGGQHLSRVETDHQVVNQAWWASVRLGMNMPARVERALRRIEVETQIMEAIGEYYDVVLFFGIIDILQDYDISKKLEHAYKSMQYDASSISAVDPKLYSKRFRDFIFKIFNEDA